MILSFEVESGDCGQKNQGTVELNSTIVKLEQCHCRAEQCTFQWRVALKESYWQPSLLSPKVAQNLRFLLFSQIFFFMARRRHGNSIHRLDFQSNNYFKKIKINLHSYANCFNLYPLSLQVFFLILNTSITCEFFVL